MAFKFELGQKVFAYKLTGFQRGTVVGRAEYIGRPVAYFIEFSPESVETHTYRAWRDEDLIGEYEEQAAT